MGKHLLIQILLLLAFSVPGFAQVYGWTDDKGDSHFTDDFTLIPERYRSHAKKIETGDAGSNTTLETKKDSDPKAYRDRMGRGEEYWTRRMQEYRSQIKALEEKNERLRSKYNDLTTKYNDSRSSVERASLRQERDQVKNEMDENRNQIERARVMLDKRIPEEAELEKAKPDWIK